MVPLSIKSIKDGVVITVYVKPLSPRDRLVLLADEIIVETKSPPNQNRANISVIKLISKALLVQPNSISLIRGATDRVKVLYALGISLDEASNRLKIASIRKEDPSKRNV